MVVARTATARRTGVRFPPAPRSSPGRCTTVRDRPSDLGLRSTVGFYIARYLTPHGLSPFVLAYGQTLAATVLLLPVLLVAGRQPTDIDASVLAAMAMLGFVGTGLAYVLNYAIIARDGPTAASTVTYLLPVVAVILGAVVLDEAVSTAVVGGALVVLVGVGLVRRAGGPADLRC